MIIKNVCCTEHDLEREELEGQYEKKLPSILVRAATVVLVLGFAVPLVWVLYYLSK